MPSGFFSAEGNAVTEKMLFTFGEAFVKSLNDRFNLYEARFTAEHDFSEEVKQGGAASEARVVAVETDLAKLTRDLQVLIEKTLHTQQDWSLKAEDAP